MIEVTANTISPSPSGLVVGLTISYSENGPIRFAQARIPWSAFSKEDRAEVLVQFNRMIGEVLAAEPVDEPLFTDL